MEMPWQGELFLFFFFSWRMCSIKPPRKIGRCWYTRRRRGWRVLEKIRLWTSRNGQSSPGHNPPYDKTLLQQRCPRINVLCVWPDPFLSRWRQNWVFKLYLLTSSMLLNLYFKMLSLVNTTCTRNMQSKQENKTCFICKKNKFKQNFATWYFCFVKSLFYNISPDSWLYSKNNLAISLHFTARWRVRPRLDFFLSANVFGRIWTYLDLELTIHPTLDPAVLWTPSNDTSRPVCSDSQPDATSASVSIRTLWRYTNAVILLLLLSLSIF